VGMTQLYDGSNALVPVTVVEVGPCPVTQVKTVDKDGYNAIQIAYQSKKERRTTQPMKGHYKKAGVKPCHYSKEIRCDDAPEKKVGDVLNLSGFSEGGKVDVIATSKGRGFQGVVKRHGFKGGPASHGSTFHRRGGSYGQCQWPGKVYKGRKMPGRMGNDRRTVQNLKIIKIMENENLILVKGSIPGANGSLVVVRSAVKGRKTA